MEKKSSRGKCQLHSDDDSFPCYLYQILVGRFKSLKKLWTVERLRLRAPGWSSVAESLNIAWLSMRDRCSSWKHVTAPKDWWALKSKSLADLNLRGEYISLSPNHVDSDWKNVYSVLFTHVILGPSHISPCIQKHPLGDSCVCDTRHLVLIMVHFLLLVFNCSNWQ